jgi:hypothetical protein
MTAIDTLKILQHLHGSVPTVGSAVPLVENGALTLTDNGFKISFDDGRHVSLYEPKSYAGMVFFEGRLGDPSDHLFMYTVQLHDERTGRLYHDVVDQLLAAQHSITHP